MRISTACFTVLMGAPQWAALAWRLLVARLIRPDSFDTGRDQRVAASAPPHPHVNGIKHEQVEWASGESVHVARAGVDPSKPFIIFLHGFPEFWYSWRHQLNELQRDFEVAAIDLPGFNASSKPRARDAYVTASVCDAIAAVLDALKRPTCVMVGHDWGGVVAADFAVLFPHRVARLALLAAPLRPLRAGMDLGQLRRSAYVFAFQAPALPELSLRQDDYAFVDAALTDPRQGGCVREGVSREEVELYKDALAAPGALKAGLNYYRARLVEDALYDANHRVRRAWKRRLEMPVLVLWGDSDRFLAPNLLQGIGRVTTSASVHIIPSCSHWIQQDAPEEVNALLRAFAHGNMYLGIPRL